ncbi:MAG: Sec-independent protein translocase protein TatB [Alphaproteobacteria bacterium]
MFDIGWQELFVIAVVALAVIGPKDLPRVLKTVMTGLAKMRHLAQEFRTGVDEVIREAELEDLKRHLEKTANAQDIGGKIKAEIDPSGKFEREIESSLKDAKIATDLKPQTDPVKDTDR